MQLTLEKVFHWLSKHLEFVKNTPLLIVFSTLFSVFGYPDETVSHVKSFVLFIQYPPDEGLFLLD